MYVSTALNAVGLRQTENLKFPPREEHLSNGWNKRSIVFVQFISVDVMEYSCATNKSTPARTRVVVRRSDAVARQLIRNTARSPDLFEI